MNILVLCHGHPALQAGGTEIAAHALFRAMRNEGHQGLFVAGVSGLHRPASPGTPFQAIGDAADEVLMRTEAFDRFFLSQTDLHGIGLEFARLLEEQRPDIVHIHHPLLIGVETIHLIRRILPAARIVMTLHDYYAICAHEGLMRTTDGRLCHGASPDACRRCLPDRSATDFRLRELHLRAMYRLVDHFVAPSRFLADRYVAWGLPAEAITVLPNGLAESAPAAHRKAARRRDRFAFFGHINAFKGATVALGASALLSREGVTHSLALHGGSDYQTEAFMTRFAVLLEAAPDARHTGGYGPAAMPSLIAEADWVVMPSVWWENAPLVIQEAFQHGRPVIASGIGGMAEMVRDGIDGLLVPPDDPAALAAAMRRAAAEPGLWKRLVGGIRKPVTIAAAARSHLALYRKLMAGSMAARQGRAA
ncbi:glycosyltransferase family 4 protein [Elioraea sp.]|uniref:glycosyltransferase family 4 protein n=1 Tax=Elioraea sp. TaxID=2185103 RepID=UPI0025C39C98|nr:glycosyltransferase family 4 protein [Elioraea sp.]